MTKKDKTALAKIKTLEKKSLKLQEQLFKVRSKLRDSYLHKCKYMASDRFAGECKYCLEPGYSYYD